LGAERLIPLVVVAAVAAGCQDGIREANERGPTDTAAVVDRVNDGDTLTLRGGRRVRLVQIDAPELFADCYGRPAARELAALVPRGAHVTLRRDPALDATDAYGRLLRYVLVGPTNVNVALVRRGAASPYFFRKARGRYANALLGAVEAARAARRGYWGACPGAELNTGLGAVTGPS
jgi:endonuclease YncB( thermonuclease family)